MALISQDSKEQIIARFARHVSSGKAEFFAGVGLDFIFGRREGVYVWDVSGQQRLIDCHCNGGVFNLGHHNPHIIAALQRALAELDIGNHHFISEHRALLAERLVALCPGDLQRVVFGVGGGEAIDLAIKLARGHTGRPTVISALGGYHGHTGLALATGDLQYRQPFGPQPPGFVQVPFGDLDALEAAMGEDTAAVLFETIGGAEVGCYAALEVLSILAEPEFLSHVRRMAGLFQEGLGRLQQKHPAVLVEVRQRGLMMGLKLADAALGPLFTLAGFHHGLLTIYANNDPAVNQLLPPSPSRRPR